LVLIELADDLVMDRLQEILGNPLADLEHDVADEPFAHEDVGLALVKAAAFDVADVAVLEPALLEKRVRLAVEVGPLAVLAADVHQTDARIFDAENAPRID